MNNSPEPLPSSASPQQLVHRTGEQHTWAATKHSFSPTAGSQNRWTTHLSSYQAQHLPYGRQQYRAWVKNSPELLPNTAFPPQQAAVLASAWHSSRSPWTPLWPASVAATQKVQGMWLIHWPIHLFCVFLFRFYIYIHKVHCILGNKHHQYTDVT